MLRNVRALLSNRCVFHTVRGSGEWAHVLRCDPAAQGTNSLIWRQNTHLRLERKTCQIITEC